MGSGHVVRQLPNEESSPFALELPATVREALQLIDLNLMGVAFLTSRGRIAGVVTDGDIRRALLKGAVDLEAHVSTIMNEHPSVLPMGAGAEETYSALSEGLSKGRRVLPRVNEDGIVKGFSCLRDWGLQPLAEPQLTGNEVHYVLDCLETNWISSSGPYVRQFEQRFADFTGLRCPVSVTNGTVAITLALQALGLKPGDEFIVPSATFAATANAVIAAGGVPVFADVAELSWGVGPAEIEPLLSNRTRGVIAVHLYGYPCDVTGIRRLCDREGLLMIEDCAEAIGSLSSGAHVGALADAATFSFFGNKTLTTGEGGMVFFNDDSAQTRARQLRDHGMSTERKYWHDVVGFNYRMTNLQAAIGVAQVERAEELVSHKRAVADLYRNGLRRMAGVAMLANSPFGESSYWLVPIILDEELAARRDELMELLAAEGIQTRVAFPALHRMPPFARFRKAEVLPVTDFIETRGLCLPNTPRMTAESVGRVLTSLEASINLALTSPLPNGG